LKQLVVITSIFAVLLFAQCKSGEQNAKELSTIVDELNKKCPQVIDSETRLDGLEFKQPNTLVYKYTLLNLNVQQLDTHQFYLAMWPGLLSTIKVSKEMQELRNNKAIIQYSYRDKAQQPVYVFTIRPEDYQ